MFEGYWSADRRFRRDNSASDYTVWYLEWPSGITGQKSDNRYRLLQVCTDHRLSLAMAKFSQSHCRCATWFLAFATQTRNQTDHTVINRTRCGCVQERYSFWSTYMESHHAFVCTEIILRSGGQQTFCHGRVDNGDLSVTEVPQVCEIDTYLISFTRYSIDECSRSCIRTRLRVC